MHDSSRIHHKFSFLWVYCGCGQQNPPLRRQIACSFVFLVELRDVPGKFPRISVGASLLSFGLFLRSVLKFHGVRTSLMRNFDLNLPSDGLCCLECLHDAAQLLWDHTRRIDSNALVPFLEIVAESGGSTSCDTQPNCRALFTTATALLSPPFFGLLLGCSSSFQCGIKHSAPNLHPDSDLWN